MKIRTGFVSNSSSSSFVAWGVYKDDIDFGDERWLDKFNKELEYYENAKNAKSEKPEDYERWYKRTHMELLDIDNDEDKIEYAKDNMDDEDTFGNDIEKSGKKRDFVGISVSSIENRHSDLKFSEVRKFVAEQLNKEFNTNFTEEDIHYYEEGWYNG